MVVVEGYDAEDADGGCRRDLQALVVEGLFALSSANF